MRTKVDWDALRQSRSITDLLRDYGIATPDRTRYRIPCPLHQGTHDNFQVDEDKGLFYCFVCSCGGSVIDLVASMEHISLKEAVDKLGGDNPPSIDTVKQAAQEAARAIPREETHKSVEIDFVFLPLEEGYRALNRETIEHFQLQNTEVGVFIPHMDTQGELVGYTIRQPEGKQPKYLNSVGFERLVPFGAYQNMQDIIDRGFAIVVEGQMDCISLWNAGYRNVVALCGSSLTEGQAHLLLALTSNLLLMLDGDKAGRAGQMKIIQKWNKAFNIKPLWLPSELDPADYLAKENDHVGAVRAW